MRGSNCSTMPSSPPFQGGDSFGFAKIEVVSPQLAHAFQPSPPMPRKIHNLKHLEPSRKSLRNHGTSAEAFLWKHLQRAQLGGRKFRRQHSIENYIVDFYCPKEKLIVELDGNVHLNANAEEYDDKRTKRLEELGFTVIRFENKMVFDFLPNVLKEIKDNFTKT